MAQRDGGGHGDGVTAKHAQFHARRALGHAVAHGRYATGHLRRSTQAAGFSFDQVGVMLQRCVGRQHIVVGRNHADVGALVDDHTEFIDAGDVRFVVVRHGRKGMGHIGAAHALRAGFSLGCGCHLL